MVTRAKQKVLLGSLLILAILFAGLSVGFVLGHKLSKRGLFGFGSKNMGTIPESSISKYKFTDKNLNSLDVTELKPGIQTQGSLTAGQVTDLYTFSVEKPATIRLVLNNVPNTYGVTVFDKDKKEIASSLRTGYLDSSATFIIPSEGQYFIRMDVDNSSRYNQPYSITLIILPLQG